MGSQDTLEEKTLTICYGNDFVNITFINFSCTRKEIAQVTSNFHLYIYIYKYNNNYMYIVYIALVERNYAISFQYQSVQWISEHVFTKGSYENAFAS